MNMWTMAVGNTLNISRIRMDKVDNLLPASEIKSIEHNQRDHKHRKSDGTVPRIRQPKPDLGHTDVSRADRRHKRRRNHRDQISQTFLELHQISRRGPKHEHSQRLVCPPENLQMTLNPFSSAMLYQSSTPAIKNSGMLIISLLAIGF